MGQPQDAARFAAAKRSPAYRDAMDTEPRRDPIAGAIVRIVAAAVVMGGLAFVMVAIGRWWMACFAGLMWLAIVLSYLRYWRAKTSWLLAIVGGEGASAIGDPYGGPTGMSHFLILRGEDGTERTLSADAMAAAGLTKGDIGVATLRGKRVVAFQQITPPVDGA